MIFMQDTLDTRPIQPDQIGITANTEVSTSLWDLLNVHLNRLPLLAAIFDSRLQTMMFSDRYLNIFSTFSGYRVVFCNEMNIYNGRTWHVAKLPPGETTIAS